MSGEDVLDPWAAEWLSHRAEAAPFDVLSPELLELARSDHAHASGRAVAHVTDDSVDGVPLRTYQATRSPPDVSCTSTAAAGSWAASA